MSDTDNERNRGIHRRTIMRSAIAGAGLAGISGLSSATPGHGGYDPCEGCGSLLTKYEWADPDEDGEYEFVFEKGRDNLDINGDEFDLTVTTDDEGEPTKVKVESILGPCSGDPIYHFDCGTVKAGPEARSLDTDAGTHVTTIEADDKYAISNFALCISEVHWQWDLGTGPAVDFYDEGCRSDVYDDEELLASYNRSGYDDQGATDRSGNYPNVTFKEAVYSDGPKAVTVWFEVQNEDEELHLVSQELPDDSRLDTIPFGPMYDTVDDVFGVGEHSMTVELPSL